MASVALPLMQPHGTLQLTSKKVLPPRARKESWYLRVACWWRRIGKSFAAIIGSVTNENLEPVNVDQCSLVVEKKYEVRGIQFCCPCCLHVDLFNSQLPTVPTSLHETYKCEWWPCPRWRSRRPSACCCCRCCSGLSPSSGVQFNRHLG